MPTIKIVAALFIALSLKVVAWPRHQKQKRPAQPIKGTGRAITMQAEESAHGIGKQDDNLIMVFADEPVVLAVLG